MSWNLNFSVGRLPNNVEIDRKGNRFYSFLDNLFGNKNSIKDTTKYTLESPALLMCRKFIADYGSLAKINSYKNNKLYKQDYLYDLAPKPNPFQTWTELIWQFFFYANAENVYLYNQNKVIYLLKRENIDISSTTLKKYQKLYFSESIKKNTLKGSFDYKNEDGTKTPLKLENLYIIDVMSGVSGDWFNGSSVLHSLKGIVDNSNQAIESKNRNLFYTTKILVSGSQTESQRLSGGVMSPQEQKSVSDTLLSSKPIHAVKDNLDTKQLVSNLKALGLDDSFNADFAKLTRMFNIPSDLIDLIVKGGVFNEGKEKSLGLYVYYTLVPMLQKLTDILEVIFEQEDLRPSFSHCPFNKVFEKEKQEDIKLQLDNLKIAKELDPNFDTSKQLKDIYDGY
jgi:hypothetical protein